jgi:lipopolysaccharide transport system ATP-binding protein
LKGTSLYFNPTRFALTNDYDIPIKMPVNNIKDIWVCVEGEIKQYDNALQIGFAIYNDNEELIFWSFHNDTKEIDWAKLKIGNNKIRAKIPKRLLNEGTYRIELLAALYFREWLLKPGGQNPNIYLDIRGGLSDSPYWYQKRPGVLAPVINWVCD